MHELSICQSMLAQVEAIALQHHTERVTGITLHIGPLAGVEPGLLQQAFSLARAVIESLPIRVRCHGCERESDALPNRLVCGHCGDYHTQLISGDEMLLASVELDIDTPTHPTQTPEQQATSGAKHV